MISEEVVRWVMKIKEADEALEKGKEEAKIWREERKAALRALESLVEDEKRGQGSFQMVGGGKSEGRPLKV